MSLANRNRATSPSQYDGAEIASSAPPIAVRSITLRLRTADRIPIGSPIISQMMTAPTVSEIVAGRRWKIMVRTGCEN